MKYLNIETKFFPFQVFQYNNLKNHSYSYHKQN